MKWIKSFLFRIVDDFTGGFLMRPEAEELMDELLKELK